MSDEAALLRAIRTNPDEDTPRLVYADWLQEHDAPERAEFIRVQCALAQLEPWTERAVDLSIRERQLLHEHRDSWIAELPLFARLRSDRFLRSRFHRGFPYSLACTATQYLKNASEVARESVIQEWTLDNFVAGAAERLAKSKHLARVRELTISHAPADALLTVLSSPHATGLRHLCLESPLAADSAALRRLGDLFALPSVRVLESLRCNYAGSPAGAEAAVFDGLVNNSFAALKRLDTHLPDLTGAAQKTAVAAGFWRGLEELTLVPTDGNITTLEALSVPALRAFHCQVMNVRSSGVRLFAAPFLREVINLSVRCLDDETADEFLASPIVEQLRILDLGSHMLSAKALRRIIDSGRLTGLVKLTVHTSSVRAAPVEEAVRIIAGTRGLSNLRLLDFGWTDVPTPSAVALASALHLPNLRAVGMRCDRVAVERVVDRFAVLEPHVS